MTDDKLIDIVTGKPLISAPKHSRQRNSQDAKRWRHLMDQLNSGEFTLSISGLDLVESGYLDATISQIDDAIKNVDRLEKNKLERIRRLKIKP